jgi:uncharacterized phage protein (TIGR01671 family)
MREYKFRAYDKFQNKIVFEGFHIVGEVTAFNMMEQIIFSTAKKRQEKYGYNSTIEAWNDFIFSQYTGLKDKNGKEIYEGDKVITNNMPLNKEYLSIKWNQKLCTYEIGSRINSKTFFMWDHLTKDSAKTLEIVGNIFEKLKDKK